MQTVMLEIHIITQNHKVTSLLFDRQMDLRVSQFTFLKHELIGYDTSSITSKY